MKKAFEFSYIAMEPVENKGTMVFNEDTDVDEVLQIITDMLNNDYGEGKYRLLSFGPTDVIPAEIQEQLDLTADERINAPTSVKVQ